MGVRMSLGEQINRNNLAVEGAKAHAKELPSEVGPLATDLAKRNANLLALNSQQEKLKQDLAQLTAKLNAEAKAAQVTRAKIVRAAEFTFGPKAPQIKEFRPVTEGRG